MYAKGHVKENQERTPCKENAGQVYGYYRPIRLSERRKDHNHLVIDEVTAPVVELIFLNCRGGRGASHYL